MGHIILVEKTQPEQAANQANSREIRETRNNGAKIKSLSKYTDQIIIEYDVEFKINK